MPLRLIIHTDGGARGNPGPAGIGVVISDESGRILGRHKKYIGKATNNSAEYQALILALKEALKISDTQPQISHIEIKMDSELVVRQMQGRYKIKESNLQILAAEVLLLCQKFKQVDFRHILREKNKEADKLVNQAIDEGQAI